MIIFDVGANTGLSTKEYISKDNLIYSFEPVPYLCKNYLYPLRSDNYFVIEKAVSDVDGVSMFNVARQDHSLTDGSLFGCSSLHEFSEDLSKTWPGRTDFSFTEKIQVQTIRMDTFIKNNSIERIDYLHCDAQGNDLKVLKSFGKYINRLISGKVECANNAKLYKDTNNDLKSITEFLNNSGFMINDIQSNDRFDNEVNILFSRI